LEFWQYLVTSHHKHQICRLYNGTILKRVVRPKTFISFSFTKKHKCSTFTNPSCEEKSVSTYLTDSYLADIFEKINKPVLFSKGKPLFIYHGCLLCRPSWKDSLEQRPSVLRLIRHAETWETCEELYPGDTIIFNILVVLWMKNGMFLLF